MKPWRHHPPSISPGPTTVRDILGHQCEGLGRFLAASTFRCIPIIDESGLLSACDDKNPVPIDYCPFCGTRLRP